MTHYVTQEAKFELPDAFKDRTMNLFTLSENNASEFTFVVSRATATPDDTLHKVAARLAKELENTVQGFQLASSTPGSIDGQPSIELSYQFISGDARIWQKQQIVILDERPQGRKIVCYIGTCQNGFDEYYQRQYEQIIASIAFTRQETFAAEMLPADSSGKFFVFDNDNKQLSVFTSITALYQHIDLQRALSDSYLFYHTQGEPLQIAPVVGSNPQEPTRYALWTSSASSTQNLASILLLCRSVNGPEELNDPERIAEYLRLSKES
ncbi:DcrB-related protein [Serratia odorifera]|uniref:DcrB-related protein n=1 Tax=Serratia odorifera TaxID=618 RepID=UPI0018E84ADA|nr:DcrB-related protein [Serratia odorifera]MBJ2064543.1 DcrB-related protein [Serratia odorifera]